PAIETSIASSPLDALLGASPLSSARSEASTSIGVCAKAGVVNAVATSKRLQVCNLAMCIPISCATSNVWRADRGVAPRSGRGRHRNYSASDGSDVQAVLVGPKSAVVELQVQPAYHMSSASLTAPM